MSKDSTKHIIEKNIDFYKERFAHYGATREGIRWDDPDTGKTILRYANCLRLLEIFPSQQKEVSLLDAGCGYGELYRLIKEQGLPVRYTGVDLSGAMIESARGLFANEPGVEFHNDDFLQYAARTEKKYDYVVCNGVFTSRPTELKNWSSRDEISLRDMDKFAKAYVKAMFSIARIGITFNHFSSHVDYFGPNLFYKSPLEALDWCLNELSPFVELRHYKPLYEFVVYVGVPE